MSRIADEHSSNGDDSLETRVATLEERFDDLPDFGREIKAINLRLSEHTELIKRAITAAEYSGRRSDAAAEDSGAAKKASEATDEKMGAILGELGEVRRLVGKWPTSPDDTGSGIAGRLARTPSMSEIDAVLVAKALAPSTPPPPSRKASTIPPALVSIWKRTRTHRRIAAILAGSFGIIWAIVQALIAARGGH